MLGLQELGHHDAELFPRDEAPEATDPFDLFTEELVLADKVGGLGLQPLFVAGPARERDGPLVDQVLPLLGGETGVEELVGELANLLAEDGLEHADRALE